jgi:Fe-S-cluster-containing hydrogenase component 2
MCLMVKSSTWCSARDKHGTGGQTSRQDPQVRVLASSRKGAPATCYSCSSVPCVLPCSKQGHQSPFAPHQQRVYFPSTCLE